jgi:hypothetical protein
MSTSYQHTQFGTIVVVALGLFLGFLTGVSAVVGWEAGSVAVATILLVAGLLFYQLDVQVAGGELRLRFGVGLVRRRFAIADIRAAQAVRNRWLQGWGIHRLARGWIYNVSGLDAVEIELADGSVHRVGSDEPRALLAALERARGEGH